jgi:hypothetical protein
MCEQELRVFVLRFDHNTFSMAQRSTRGRPTLAARGRASLAAQPRRSLEPHSTPVAPSTTTRRRGGAANPGREAAVVQNLLSSTNSNSRHGMSTRTPAERTASVQVREGESAFCSHLDHKDSLSLCPDIDQQDEGNVWLTNKLTVILNMLLDNEWERELEEGRRLLQAQRDANEAVELSDDALRLLVAQRAPGALPFSLVTISPPCLQREWGSCPNPSLSFPPWALANSNRLVIQGYVCSNRCY